MHLIAFWALTVAPATYTQARAELDETVDSARELEPAKAAEALTAVVEGVEAYPVKLAGDPELLARRDFALMALAFSHFSIDELDEANAVIDEAIRSANGRELPFGRFGPDFKALYQERAERAAQLGMAELKVSCEDCQVYVNEQRASDTLSLYLGTYRVWVVQGAERSFSTLELSEAGQLVEWPPVSPTTVPAPELDEAQPVEPSLESSNTQPLDRPAEGRRLPRWASATGIGIGAALMITGGILLSYHGKCPDGLDPVLDRPDCPDVYNARPAGYSLLFGGAAVFTSFGVVLALDEVRTRRGRAPSVALSYTLRF